MEGKSGEGQLLEDILLGLVGDRETSIADDLPQRLLSYAVQWNSRARTCHVAQRVLNWVVTNWSPERLLQWPDIGKAIEAFIPYTGKSFQNYYSFTI